MTHRILRGDVLAFSRHYASAGSAGEPFHALLADPPYHLNSIIERFSKTGGADRITKPGTPYARTQRGFMGKTWDGGDLAFRPETWAALSELLYPGAFLMCFAGTRGYHRMACAMEDAGLIIHPALGWLNGQGFPKATRIDTAIDKAAGEERTEHEIDIDFLRRNPDSGASERGIINKGHADGLDDAKRSKPATPLAATWQGHRYGLQALKPAFEFVAVAQKPYQGRPVDSITRTGAGALWIDGGRIITNWEREESARYGHSDKTTASNGVTGWGSNNMHSEPHPSGRWPANFALSHLPDCNGDCAPGCPVAALDEMSGERPATGRASMKRSNGDNQFGYSGPRESNQYSDSGGASRFYFNADWNAETLERLDAALPVRCILCDSEIRRHGIMSETHKEHIPCEDANTVTSSSSPSGQSKDFAPTPVRQNGQRRDAAKSGKSKSNASGAGRSKRNTRATTENSVVAPAPILLAEQLAHSAKSAANLCDLCATAIAQSLVQIGQGLILESLPILDSITERSQRILSHSLALYVENLEQTDTTPTTQSLNKLLGFVSLVTENSTLKRLESVLPVLYKSKAGRRERDAGLEDLPLRDKYSHNGRGNSHEIFTAESANDSEWSKKNPAHPMRNIHPTCKPISLVKWMAQLLLPPAAYAPRRLLVPFSGSGSEMIGAMLAGWEDVIGIERDREYATIGRARLAWWQELLRWGHTDIDAMLRQWSGDETDDSDSDDTQLSLF